MESKRTPDADLWQVARRLRPVVIMASLRRDLLAKHQLMGDLKALSRTRKIMRRELAALTKRPDTAFTALGDGALPLEIVDGNARPTKKEK